MTDTAAPHTETTGILPVTLALEPGTMVLVTGSAGFVGMFVAQQLLERGVQVVGVDACNDYYDPALKEARTAQLMQYKQFSFIRGDISDRAFVSTLFAEHTFDAVVHLAAQAGVRYSVTHPHAYADANLVGFLNVLDAARHAGCNRFVYASSSSVYGASATVPFSITDRADTPVSLYAATKRANELIAHSYSHLYGMHITGLRFFTVIGPYGRPDMAPLLFTQAMLAGEPIRVFNHGKMRRDFTYVTDVAVGVLAALERTNGYQLYNLGNNAPVELEYFITLLGNALGVTPQKEYVEMQPGDMVETYADITHTTKALGWTPTTTIEDAVQHVADWYTAYYR